MQRLAKKLCVLLCTVLPTTGFCLGELEGDAAIFFDETCVNYKYDYSDLKKFLDHIEAKKLDPEKIKEAMPMNPAGGKPYAYVVKKGPVNKVIAFSNVACSMLIMKKGFDGEAVRDHFVSSYSLGKPKFKEERSFVLNEAYATKSGTLKGHVMIFMSASIPGMDNKTYVLGLITPEGVRLTQN